MFRSGLALCFLIGSVLCGVCPPADRIKPCICSETTIDCTSDTDLDLDRILMTIASDKEPQSEELAFETFILNNSRIASLKKNMMFQGITFETIKLLDCHQLSCVSPSAFRFLETNLTNFIAINTNLSSTDKECNIFEAINTLYNLRAIAIIQSSIIEIPANAFNGKSGALDRLNTIDLSGGFGGHITRIGREAFSTLKGLRKVDLSSHRISKVESFAFAFDSPSSERLTIDLSHNDLNDKSFDVESFEVNERITDLRLSANPKLKVLSESVFVPFLMNRRNASVENQIDLTGTQLSCCDKNVWLFQREASLHLFNKLKNVLAEDGQDFWRHNWLECSKRLCG